MYIRENRTGIVSIVAYKSISMPLDGITHSVEDSTWVPSKKIFCFFLFGKR